MLQGKLSQKQKAQRKSEEPEGNRFDPGQVSTRWETKCTTSVLMVMNGKDRETSLDKMGVSSLCVMVELLIRVHQSRLQKVKGDLEQERIARKDPQLTSESAPDCQQHQSDSGSKNEEISHSEETIPESTSDLDAESEPLEEDGEHHPNDTETATRIDPARIEPGQIITYNHMDTGTKISAKVLSKAGKASETGNQWHQGTHGKEHCQGSQMADFTYSVGGLPHKERCFISKAAASSSRRKDFLGLLNCITKAR